MGLFPFATCPCPCWPRSSSNKPSISNQSINQSNHSESLPDERTPLITNPPPITPSPHLPIIDTAQQQADEAAANKIVHETVRCLVDVYSHAPFSHLRIPGSNKPMDSVLHLTPDGTSSTWRAYDPPICPPVSSQGCRSRLGFDEPKFSSNKQCTPKHEDKNQKINHQRSFHSLKTIINHNQTLKQDESIKQINLLFKRNSKSDVCLPSSSSSSQYQESPSKPCSNPNEMTPHHSRQNSMAPTSTSTQFNTINSFQTARDDTNSEMDLPDYLLNQSNDILSPQSSHDSSIQKPQFVQHLWNHNFSLSSNSKLDHSQIRNDSELSHNLNEQESDFLTDDPQKLSEMISNGFQLKDPGPILVEL